MQFDHFVIPELKVAEPNLGELENYRPPNTLHPV